MQSSLTTYFKTKKRVRDEHTSKKSSASKLVALTAASSVTTETTTSSAGNSEVQQGHDSPIPIRANVSTTSESSTSQSSILEVEDTTLKNEDVEKEKPVSAVPSSPLRPPCPNWQEKREAQNLQRAAAIEKFVLESTANNANNLLSPRKAISISDRQFYSPGGSQTNIFTSPVKLAEIKSPSKLSPSARLVAKRLFNTISQSPTKVGDGNGKGNESEDGPPPSKKIPAYQRFHHLAQKTPTEISLAPSTSSAASLPVRLPEPTNAETTKEESEKIKPKIIPIASTSEKLQVGRSTKQPNVELPLPYKFKVLQELFHALETVSSIYHNRKELITLSKVKPAVQEIVRKVQFKEKHLEQILTVFPDCYNVTQDKVKTPNSVGVVELSHQLVLTINLKATTKTSTETETLSPGVITERRRVFRENLLKICYSHHQEFLSSLQPPIIIPPNKTVTRWHPKFHLDEIPDINPVKKLPQTPETSKNTSAKEIISKAQNILDNANPRMKKALAELLKKKTIAQEEKTGSSSSTAPIISEKAQQDNKISNKNLVALKGVSQSLIDKIRAREQEAAIRAMTLTPEENKNRTMMNRLPELVKSVRNTMVAEKRSALPLGFLAERLSHSNHGLLTTYEIEDHIRLLCKFLPSWASILKLSQGEYLKINKDTNINDLLAKFNDVLQNQNNK